MKYQQNLYLFYYYYLYMNINNNNNINKNIKIKYQIGGIYNANGTNNKQKKIDMGAGIILVEDYYDFKTKNYRPVIILFKNKFFGMFEDLGGSKNDKTDSSKQTAIRDAQEESCNLFNLPQDLLDDNKAIRIKNYVGYIVHIKAPDDKNLNLKWYDYNRNLLDEYLNGVKPNKIENAFDETIEITRIYTDQLLDDNIFDAKGDFDTIDINNKETRIFARTKSILITAFYNDLIDTAEYIELYECRYRSNDDKFTFLNGTKTYH